MSLSGIILGLINIAIVVAILILVGLVIVWLLSWLKFAVPQNVQHAYLAVVVLIALYMVVALIFGIPTLRIIGAPGPGRATSQLAYSAAMNSASPISTTIVPTR